MKLKQISEDFIVEEISLNEKFLDKGKYQIFLLEKKDYDTEKIILKLSEIFRIPRKFFGYAGNKDRKAITKQYCSVKIIDNKLIKNIETNNFKISVLGFSNEPISLGNLKGNNFIITIRDLDERELKFFLNKFENKFDKKINNKINNNKKTNNKKKEIEFINYFDEQRFGKNNYEIGYSLIKKDFKKATALIDFIDVKKHLEVNKNDYIGAIKKVPFKILTMYINSVQSYLFNEFCCEYVKKKVKKFVEVDYHLTKNKIKKIKKFVFTNEKIKNFEIPLISFDSDFKKKEISEIYENILKRENISLSDFIIRQIPELTAIGSSRNLIATSRDLNIIEYGDDELNNLNKKKIKISFSLDKGNYATVFVKYLFSTYIANF